jgi:UDP-3-O-[3-hydroxymyristoyl] glucosamine N-acyltransferase
VRIGAHTAIAGNSGIAGSARIGRYCLLGGGAGVAGHIELADRTTVAAATNVMRSITESGQTVSSQFQAVPLRDWQRNLARLRQLEALNARVRRLEKSQGKPSDE